MLVDSAGFIRYRSKGAERLFGHLAENALGRSLDLIVPEGFRAPHWQGFRLAMASATAKIENQSSTFPVTLANGQVASALGRLTLLRGLDGNAIGAMVIFG